MPSKSNKTGVAYAVEITYVKYSSIIDFFINKRGAYTSVSRRLNNRGLSDCVISARKASAIERLLKGAGYVITEESVQKGEHFRYNYSEKEDGSCPASERGYQTEFEAMFRTHILCLPEEEVERLRRDKPSEKIAKEMFGLTETEFKRQRRIMRDLDGNVPLNLQARPLAPLAANCSCTKKTATKRKCKAMQQTTTPENGLSTGQVQTTQHPTQQFPQWIPQQPLQQPSEQNLDQDLRESIEEAVKKTLRRARRRSPQGLSPPSQQQHELNDLDIGDGTRLNITLSFSTPPAQEPQPILQEPILQQSFPLEPILQQSFPQQPVPQQQLFQQLPLQVQQWPQAQQSLQQSSAQLINEEAITFTTELQLPQQQLSQNQLTEQELLAPPVAEEVASMLPPSQQVIQESMMPIAVTTPVTFSASQQQVQPQFPELGGDAMDVDIPLTDEEFIQLLQMPSDQPDLQVLQALQTVQPFQSQDMSQQMQGAMLPENNEDMTEEEELFSKLIRQDAYARTGQDSSAQQQQPKLPAQLPAQLTAQLPAQVTLQGRNGLLTPPNDANLLLDQSQLAENDTNGLTFQELNRWLPLDKPVTEEELNNIQQLNIVQLQNVQVQYSQVQNPQQQNEVYTQSDYPMLAV